MKNKIFFIGFLSVILCYGSAYADRLIFDNGLSMEGVISQETEDEIALDIGGGTVKFKRSKIERVIRSSNSENKSLIQNWKVGKAKRASEIPSFAKKRGTVKMEHGVSGMVVNTLLNKKVNAKLVLDTGASLVVLSRPIARRLGINMESKDIIQVGLADGTEVNAVRAVLDYVSVEGVQLENVETAVILSEGETLLNRDGLLGMSFLGNFNFRIDTDNGELILERK